MGCSISKNLSIQACTQNIPASRKITSVHEISVKPEYFVLRNESSFNLVYRLGKQIGHGRYGEVRLCYVRETNEKRAVKIFKKDESNQLFREKVLEEISIMKTLDHPKIVRIYEYFESFARIHIIMEYCKGGELFSEIVTKQIFSESQAIKIIYDLLLAVCYMHENQIIHRDIKPENILLEDKSSYASIKLIDFGSAVQGTIENSEKIGTIFYMAPEVLQGSYNDLCDMWSVGVVLYLLLSGIPPFIGNESDVAEKIEKLDISYTDPVWQCLSKEGIDFIQKLLCKAEFRLSAAQALNHLWFSTRSFSFPPEFDNVLENLAKFHYSSKFKQAVSAFLVTQCLQDSEIRNLQNVFIILDTNSDGKISKDELIQYFLQDIEIDEAKTIADQVMSNLDTDKNGYIDYFEFLAATVDQKKLLSLKNIKKAFAVFDTGIVFKIGS